MLDIFDFSITEYSDHYTYFFQNFSNFPIFCRTFCVSSRRGTFISLAVIDNESRDDFAKRV